MGEEKEGEEEGGTHKRQGRGEGESGCRAKEGEAARGGVPTMPLWPTLCSL